MTSELRERLRLAWGQMEKSNARWLYIMICALTTVAIVRSEGRPFLPIFVFVHLYTWVGFYYKAVGK